MSLRSFVRRFLRRPFVSSEPHPHVLPFSPSKKQPLAPPSCPPLTHSPRAISGRERARRSVLARRPRRRAVRGVVRVAAALSPAVPAPPLSICIGHDAVPLAPLQLTKPSPSPSRSALTLASARRSRPHPATPLAAIPAPSDFGLWIGTKGFSNRVRAAAPSQLEIHLRRRDDAVRRPRRLQRRRSAAAKEGAVPPPPLEVGAADPRPLSGPAAAPGMLKVGTPRSRRPRPPDGSPAARSRHPPCSSHSTMPLPDLRFKVYDFNPTVSSKSWL